MNEVLVQGSVGLIKHISVICLYYLYKCWGAIYSWIYKESSIRDAHWVKYFCLNDEYHRLEDFKTIVVPQDFDWSVNCFNKFFRAGRFNSYNSFEVCRIRYFVEELHDLRTNEDCNRLPTPWFTHLYFKFEDERGNKHRREYYKKVKNREVYIQQRWLPNSMIEIYTTGVVSSDFCAFGNEFRVAHTDGSPWKILFIRDDILFNENKLDDFMKGFHEEYQLQLSYSGIY